MSDREHELPITRQAEVSRGSFYYLPRRVLDVDLTIIRRLDRLHLEYPFAGLRMLRGLLTLRGCKIGRRHVKTLMKRMEIGALYRRPRTTKPEPSQQELSESAARHGDHTAKPGLGHVATMQVHCADITCIPMARGFVYLAVVLDWATRRVLSSRLSVTMKLRSVSRRWRMPWLVTASRRSSTRTKARSSPVRRSPVCSPATGSPPAWTTSALGTTTCSSGGCSAASNTRRYLRAYQTAGEARASIGRYLDFYKGRRPHSSLDDVTTDQAYFTPLPVAWQPNPGRGSTYRGEKSVQTTGTVAWTSVLI